MILETPALFFRLRKRLFAYVWMIAQDGSSSATKMADPSSGGEAPPIWMERRRISDLLEQTLRRCMGQCKDGFLKDSDGNDAESEQKEQRLGQRRDFDFLFSAGGGRLPAGRQGKVHFLDDGKIIIKRHDDINSAQKCKPEVLACER